MPQMPPWTRVSIFAERSESRRDMRSRVSAASRAASFGAAVFIVGAQVMMAIMLFWKRSDNLDVPPLLLLASCFNGVMLWNWAANPGYVLDSESEIPPGEVEEDLYHWCLICRLWQPLRAKHCARCDRCVRKYDHHCFWIGGCVGEANHCRFFLLLILSFVYLLWLFQETLECFSLFEHPNIDSAILYNIAPFLFLVVIGFSGLLILLLGSFHALLLVTNKTTWEFSSRDRITYLRSQQGNPFDKGLLSNLKFLFHRRPIDWRAVLRLSERHAEMA